MRKTGAGPGTGTAGHAGRADVDEYAEVFRESNGQLVAYATSLTGSTWVAEDLVAEAHFRVWRRMRAGHAVDNVPAYLMTTVRNLAAGLGRARKEIARDWHELPDGAANEAIRAIGAVQAQDPEQRASHVDLLARLLKELPGRWATALWYAEVEGLPLEAVGARIGANANTAGVVLARARERLRQAFLQEQSGSPLSTDCEQYWKHMAAVVRGTASDRRNKLVLEHTEDCDDCRTRLLALTETNERLPILLGPALLGVVLGGGAWLIPTLSSAGAGATAAKAAGAGAGARHARQGTRAFRRARSQLLKRGTSNTGRMVVGSFSAVGAVAGVAVVAVALASSSGSGHAAASAAVPTTAAPVSTTATATTNASSPAAGSSVLAPTSATAPTTNAAAAGSAAPVNAAPTNTASTAPKTSADTASSAPVTTPTSASTSATTATATPSATSTTSASVAPLASTSSVAPSSTSSSTPQNTASSTPTPTATQSTSSSSASAQPIVTSTVTPSITPSLTPSLTPTATITPTPTATTAASTTTPTSTDSCDLRAVILCVN